MDNAYKTNKYRLYFLEIVGVTSTGLTFLAAFVLLSSECEINFIWALKSLRGLFLRANVFPEVIVSDRNLALMNAINFVDSRETWDFIMDAWGTVMDCVECDAFEWYVKQFKCVCFATTIIS